MLLFVWKERCTVRFEKSPVSELFRGFIYIFPEVFPIYSVEIVPICAPLEQDLLHSIIILILSCRAINERLSRSALTTKKSINWQTIIWLVKHRPRPPSKCHSTLCLVKNWIVYCCSLLTRDNNQKKRRQYKYPINSPCVFGLINSSSQPLLYSYTSAQPFGNAAFRHSCSNLMWRSTFSHLLVEPPLDVCMCVYLHIRSIFRSACLRLHAVNVYGGEDSKATITQS